MARSNAKSSLLFALMTLISRILGLLRDVMVARFFATSITDPFFAALRIPNTLRRFFAEGGFANAFVPVFSQTKASEENKLPDLVQHTAGALLFVLLVITAIGVIFSGTLLYLIAHGLVAKPEQFVLGKQMLAIMFPYILFISLTAMAGGILNSFSKFAIPALTPAILNITLITACIYKYFVGTSSGIELAWAVFWGGVLQLAVQIPFLYKLNLLLVPKWGFGHQGVKKIMRLMLPTLFGSSVGQLAILFNTFLASHLITGSISWLYYTDRMVELPVALIGVALGTVILPRLSALKAENNQAKFVQTLDWAMRIGILIGSASSVGLVILAQPILATIFYGGHFSANDIIMTSLSLQFYGIAVIFLILTKILAPAFYSRYDTKTPVKAGIIAMVINICVAPVLGYFFQHIGLAFSSTIAAAANAFLLLYFLTKTQVKLKINSALFFAQIIFANIAMATVLFYLKGNLDLWLNLSFGTRILKLLVLIITALITYFAALYLTGLRKNNFRE